MSVVQAITRSGFAGWLVVNEASPVRRIIYRVSSKDGGVIRRRQSMTGRHQVLKFMAA